MPEAELVAMLIGAGLAPPLESRIPAGGSLRATFIDATRAVAAARGCRAPQEHADVLTVMVGALITRHVVIGPQPLARPQLAEALTMMLGSC